MIFLTSSTEPTLIVMLTEQDCNDMRGGRTKFVDKSATSGHLFDKVVFSLHKNRGEIEEMVTKAGHGALLKGMPSPGVGPLEAKCTGCEGIMTENLLLDGKCITCWRELAKVQERRST
jgi:hypothetical protein